MPCQRDGRRWEPVKGADYRAQASPWPGADPTAGKGKDLPVKNWSGLDVSRDTSRNLEDQTMNIDALTTEELATLEDLLIKAGVDSKLTDETSLSEHALVSWRHHPSDAQPRLEITFEASHVGALIALSDHAIATGVREMLLSYADERCDDERCDEE